MLETFMMERRWKDDGDDVENWFDFYILSELISEKIVLIVIFLK